MPSFARMGNDLYTGRRSHDFVGRRRLWYAVAATMMLVSVLAVVFQGLNPGIEFRGGSEFRVTGTSLTSEQVGQDAVASVMPDAQVRVSRLNEDSIRVQVDRVGDDERDRVQQALAESYRVDAQAVSYSFVGPTWGEDVTRQALIGLFAFLALVTVVISLYFRTWTMALAALVALLHDLVITVGVYALVGFEVTPASVIGFLTILGYSLYDTVVVFDKVRENTEHVLASTKRTFAEAANLAVNQTLVRSVNTSVVALLPVAAILFIGAYLLGAGTLKDIALSLFVGIAAGTYSSIFIATPMLVHLREREPEVRAQAERVARRREREETEPDLEPVAVAAGPVDEAGVQPGDDGTFTEPAGHGGRPLRPGSGQRQQPRRPGRRR